MSSTYQTGIQFNDQFDNNKSYKKVSRKENKLSYKFRCNKSNHNPQITTTWIEGGSCGYAYYEQHQCDGEFELAGSALIDNIDKFCFEMEISGLILDKWRSRNE